MKTIRGVCIDLSGTLHIEDTLTPGALEALTQLRSHESQLQIRFVSNTSKDSSASLVARLRRLGFTDALVPAAAVFTSLSAAAKKAAIEKRTPLLLVANEAKADFETPKEGAVFDAVVVGLAPHAFEYESLSHAMNVLLEAKAGNKNPMLIATHKGRYFQRKDGLAMGPGPFVAALEYATGIEAQVVGKPEPAFFKLALDDMGLQPDECVHIGDDVRDDVGGAMAVGMRGILVRTGKYRPGDETTHGITPSSTVQDFSAAVDLILRGLV
ncbi:Haloacid dehalogenase-like hydrolase domain-containing protein 2 [Rhizoclosmatium sp. JEL0117]|nr:Haloacid dehalogenase-like hydrolase domain-containing protein 2 [Rhizoclosmatium sp. JEL0117]